MLGIDVFAAAPQYLGPDQFVFCGLISLPRSPGLYRLGLFTPPVFTDVLEAVVFRGVLPLTRRMAVSLTLVTVSVECSNAWHLPCHADFSIRDLRL